MRNLCEKFTLIRTLANCLFYYQPAFQERQILEEHFHRILWSPVESMFPLTHGQHDLLMKTVKIEIKNHLRNFRTAQGLLMYSEAQRLRDSADTAVKRQECKRGSILASPLSPISRAKFRRKP